MDTTKLIKQILLAFEQSSTKIQYKQVYEYEDGPKNIKQITVSFGVTEYGNLKKLLTSYCDMKGQYASEFSSYLPVVGIKPLAENKDFISLLKKSGDDIVMQMCQEQAYDDMYITPSLAWCEKNNLTLPLSKLVIADSFLQSGSILTSIRSMFPETLPVVGGREESWVTAYCSARKKWLANHSRKILHNTVYRMDFMIKCILANDWNLTKNTYIANDVKIVAN